MDRRRVVVTGLGVVSPLGSDLELFWKRITSGYCAVRRIQRFDPRNGQWLTPPGGFEPAQAADMTERDAYVVKNAFRDAATGCICPKDLPRCVCGRKPRFQVLTASAIYTTTESEIIANIDGTWQSVPGAARALGGSIDGAASLPAPRAEPLRL